MEFRDKGLLRMEFNPQNGPKVGTIVISVFHRRNLQLREALAQVKARTWL